MKMSKAKTVFFLSRKERTERRFAVVKNTGGIEVERLRGRLIRELRERGSQEGKRQKKNGRNRGHSI